MPFPQRQSQLADYRASLEAAFRPCPPATGAEAGARSEALTGLKRGPTQVRQFLQSLGRKLRKVGHIPAQAEVPVPEACKTAQLEPRLAEAKAAQRVVFFMAAAPFVLAPFWGLGWCFERLFVKAPTGRQRLKVRAALPAPTRTLFPVTTLTSLTSETVCEVLRLLAGVQGGVPSTRVLAHARSHRCALVQSVAQSLGSELLFLPAYSPTLNLSERVWQFVKKRGLSSKYSPDPRCFQQAILACIEQAPDKDQQELASLLTLKFHTFKAVRVIGEASTVCLFPVAKKAQEKVSSKAA